LVFLIGASCSRRVFAKKVMGVANDLRTPGATFSLVGQQQPLCCSIRLKTGIELT